VRRSLVRSSGDQRRLLNVGMAKPRMAAVPKHRRTADRRRAPPAMPGWRACSGARRGGLHRGPARQFASECTKKQSALIRGAVENCLAAVACPSAADRWFLAGSGEFLARRVILDLPCLPAEQIALRSAELLGPEVSAAACAHALAVLAAVAMLGGVAVWAGHSPSSQVGGSLF